jgi:hypothetical protein
MDVRRELPQPPDPLRVPAPLNRLPWNLAQDQFGPQGADFLGAMGTVLLEATKDEFRAYLTDSTVLADTLPAPAAKDEFRAYLADSTVVAGTLPPPAAKDASPAGS